MQHMCSCACWYYLYVIWSI